ncbi:5852_t:CDS:2 [Ambispora gerdemannii]|uniref:5852_t:CDS:1 n=1 Tax=Ambispora gerdemannii TaxID=144530 RepID=A0A9N9H2S5_9GLOM|nr:5852_t:CDS:2 [Ambispora gerdemannii]
MGSGSSDSGGFCKKCQKKVSNNRDSRIEFSDVLKFVEHVKNCSEYKEAQEKVQAEPNRYELKEKNGCCCSHRDNLLSPCNRWKSKYINENGKEVDEKGQTHDQVCRCSRSRGGIVLPYSLYDEFLKVKLGQVCPRCQEVIDEELEN